MISIWLAVVVVRCQLFEEVTMKDIIQYDHTAVLLVPTAPTDEALPIFG